MHWAKITTLVTGLGETKIPTHLTQRRKKLEKTPTHQNPQILLVNGALTQRCAGFFLPPSFGQNVLLSFKTIPKGFLKILSFKTISFYINRHFILLRDKIQSLYTRKIEDLRLQR